MSKDKQEAFETFEFDLPPIRGFPELRWAGKRPFRSTQYFPAQKKESYGDPTDGWWNKIFWGDNLQVMAHLLREYRGKVDLIYIDPPFDSGADYKKKVKIRGKEVGPEYSAFEDKQYGDIWSNDQFLQFIYERLAVSRELLADSGSIFFHCDSGKNYLIRALLDEVFGPSSFRNEIIWKRRVGSTSAVHNSNQFGEATDTILFYSKTSDAKFYPQYNKEAAEYQEYIKSRFTYEDGNGRLYQPTSLVNPAYRPNLIYDYKGYKSPPNGWMITLEKMEQWDREGRLHFPDNPGSRIRRKSFADELKGMPVQNLWTDIKEVNSQASERVNYPTQKPENLLERVLKCCTDDGDLVLDFFMGSGTTQSVAMKLGRRFLGADINLGAIETTIKRLNGARASIETGEADLFAKDDVSKPSKFYTGFEFYNVNNYDLFRNPVEAKELIREAMELQPLPPGAVFDGQREDYLVKIMPVNRIATRADLNEVINGLDFKAFEARAAKAPNKAVERIHLVCMGHEPDLGPELVKAAKPFDIDVIVTDLIRDKSHLHFKRSSDARLKIEAGHLVIAGFYPMNLLQKLSMEADAVEDWRQLVETIKVDWNYDGAVLTPAIVDAPEGEELVAGRYLIPEDASTIRVKITDLLSESWEGEIENA